MATDKITRSAQQAFSMIELMVVVAIASILIMLAVPSFRQTIDRQKVSTVASDLYGAVSLTRSEAIRRGARVELNATGAWINGWTVSVRDSSGNITTLYTHAPVAPTVTFFPLPAFGNSLAYDGTGRARQGSTGSFVVTGGWGLNVGNQRRLVQIEGTGRPRLCDPGPGTSGPPSDAACQNSG